MKKSRWVKETDWLELPRHDSLEGLWIYIVWGHADSTLLPMSGVCCAVQKIKLNHTQSMCDCMICETGVMWKCDLLFQIHRSAAFLLSQQQYVGLVSDAEAILLTTALHRPGPNKFVSLTKATRLPEHILSVDKPAYTWPKPVLSLTKAHTLPEIHFVN